MSHDKTESRDLGKEISGLTANGEHSSPHNYHPTFDSNPSHFHHVSWSSGFYEVVSQQNQKTAGATFPRSCINNKKVFCSVWPTRWGSSQKNKKTPQNKHPAIAFPFPFLLLLLLSFCWQIVRHCSWPHLVKLSVDGTKESLLQLNTTTSWLKMRTTCLLNWVLMTLNSYHKDVQYVWVLSTFVVVWFLSCCVFFSSKDKMVSLFRCFFLWGTNVTKTSVASHCQRVWQETVWGSKPRKSSNNIWSKKKPRNKLCFVFFCFFGSDPPTTSETQHAVLSWRNRIEARDSVVGTRRRRCVVFASVLATSGQNTRSKLHFKLGMHGILGTFVVVNRKLVPVQPQQIFFCFYQCFSWPKNIQKQKTPKTKTK